jgi:iron-sulfur cluster assembly accessory protein
MPDQATDKLITLTPQAAAKVRALMAQPEQAAAQGLRVKVVGGGCSGLNYAVELAREPEENDAIFESEGVTIYLDPKSALFIGGTRIDYHESMMGSGFAFENPKATGTCGCGTSFTT